MIRPFKRVRKYALRGQKGLLYGFRDQFECSKDGIALVRQLLRDEMPSDKVRQKMSDIEHRGDQARFDFIAMLSRTLSVPIDREDMFRVSRSIDDILDTMRDFVRLYDMFGVEGVQPEMLKLLDAIDDGTDNLEVAVHAMMKNPRNIRRAAITAKKNRVRHFYQDALAAVVNRELDNSSLKLLELFHKLNEAGASVILAADILSDGAVKRSH